MRTLRFLLQKEFRQIFRNKDILRVIFMMPIVQLLVLPRAADYEVKNISLTVVDHDVSVYSRQLISKITSSGYFKLVDYTQSYNAARTEVEKNQADIILQIPPHFERDFAREQKANLFMAVNAINGVKAILGSSYLQSVILDFNNQIRTEWVPPSHFNQAPAVEVLSENWYNPHMNYQLFMVPGILAVLVTMVGSFLAALNIVVEKENGTIEQINVTPVKKYHFILGKLIPFWLLGLVILTIGFFLSWVFYSIVPVGSFFTLYVFAALYLLALLGMGLLISTISSTQQQAMLISFFIMMTFIMLSGLYTPIESMPVWAQWITKLNPVTYFIEVVRRVVLKGSGLADIKGQLLAIFIFAVVLNTWAVLSYRKRSA
jgi:ABC-2 type transport system permease protein